MVEELPFGLEISSERLVTSARRVAPHDWVQTNVEAALDELTPYVVGDRDTFEVKVQLSDRAELALEEVKALLRESDATTSCTMRSSRPRLRRAWGKS